MILASTTFAATTHADTVLACRKRNAFVYTSFTWVEIDRDENGQMWFMYGNGIEDQMMTIYLRAPIDQISENKYAYHDDSIGIDALVEKKKLRFTLESGGKTISKKNYDCVIQNP